MPFYLVQEEDGTSRIELEEGGGFLTLEAGDGPDYARPVDDSVAISDSFLRVNTTLRTFDDTKPVTDNVSISHRVPALPLADAVAVRDGVVPLLTKPFPVDAGRAGTNSAVSGTSHSLNLPASIASGDLLVAIVRCPAATTITWPAGWTEHEQTTADASDDDTSIAFRYADGTEGATITITLGTARVLVGLCYRITGAVGIAISPAVVGSATQPNSPSFAPLTIANNVLWLSIGGCDDSEALTSGPASYSSATVQGSTLTGTTGCTVYGASRQANAISEDPGAWTLATTSIWTAWTVALLGQPFPSRLSQLPIEVLVFPTPDARLSQLPLEVLVLPIDPDAQVSQVVTEVLRRNLHETVIVVIWE